MIITSNISYNHNMNNLLKFIIILFMFTQSLSAQTELKKVTLQLSWLDQFQFAGYYIAKEKGFYEDLGLDVEIKPFQSNIDIPKEVSDNKIDFSIGRENLLLERVNNKKIVALFALYQTSPLVLISTKKSKINSISDFKGKRIMATLNDANQVSLKAMISSNNINLDDLKFIKHTHNIKDLVNKRTDVISAYTSKAPFYLQKEGINYNIFDPKDYGFDMYSDFLYTSEKLIANDPKTVKAFKKASLKGWEYAYSNIEESALLIQKKYNTQKLSRYDLLFEAKELKKLSFYKTNILGNIDKNKLQRIVDLYNVMGLLENKIDINNFYYDGVNNLQFSNKEKEYLKKKEIITMCIAPEWMPYEKFDENGKHIGITSDYFKIFQENIEIPIQIIKTDTWAQSIEFAKNRKCDILSLAIKTKDREKYLNFTDSYFDTSFVLAAKSTTQFIDNLENLKNVRIGVLKGSSFIETLENNYPFISIVEIDNIDDGLKKVQNNELFGFIDSYATIGYLLQTQFLGKLHIAGKFKKQFKLGIAVRNDEPILLDIFNSVIRNLPFDTKQRIFNKYISIKYENVFNYEVFWKVGLVLLLAFALLFYRYRIMQIYTREIERYLDLVNNNVLISSSDKEGIITDASEALCRLSGYKKEELIGKSYRIFKHKDMDEEVFKDLWKTISLGNFWQGEIKNLNKDGSSYWAKVKITTLFDKDKNIKGYSAILEDITNKKEIEKLSITDTLTKIPNRLYLDRNFQHETMRANRYNSELSLMIMDIDFFKKVNDNYGHKIGDDVLVKLADILKQNIREVDILGRWGGEEFLIICPETNIKDAKKLAEKLRKEIASYKFETVGHLTSSFGVTQYLINDNQEEAFNRCDKALYKAKEQGRNRVISII